MKEANVNLTKGKSLPNETGMISFNILKESPTRGMFYSIHYPGTFNTDSYAGAGEDRTVFVSPVARSTKITIIKQGE